MVSTFPGMLFATLDHDVTPKGVFFCESKANHLSSPPFHAAIWREPAESMPEPPRLRLVGAPIVVTVMEMVPVHEVAPGLSVPK